MKKIILFSALLILFAFSSWAEGKPLLFIGQQKDTLERYLDEVDHVPDGFMTYTSIQYMDGLVDPSNQGAGVHHAQYWVDMYPTTNIQIGLYMVNALEDVAQGTFDHNLNKLSKWIKSIKGDVYLRIGYEFDFPENHYDPQNFQVAFRYVVDYLRKEDVNNVCFVWHSAAMLNQEIPVLEWYPGDEYVDYFGISLFASHQKARGKEFFSEGRRRGKKLMIAESTPSGLNIKRSKMGWFKSLFKFIESEGVDVLCYINSNWEDYPMFKPLNWGDARVQQDPELKALWLEKIK